MKIVFATVLLAGTAIFGITASQALPLAPLATGDTSAVVQVRDGCGYERHRGPGGACRPRYNCPFGWHPGPYGWRCFRN